jgi:hypothetical protein
MVAVLVSTLTLFLTPVILSSFDFARVAQWIERLPPEQEAAGSNPAAGITEINGPPNSGPFLLAQTGKRGVPASLGNTG